MPTSGPTKPFEYDVAISFAGEQRKEAEALAQSLGSLDFKVFYDRYEEANLWGKDLYEHLAEVYQKKARYCLMLVSKDYEQKVWPTHERRSAMARALEQKGEYILPVRFDDTVVPGLLPTIGYISFRDHGPHGITTLLADKLRGSQSSVTQAAKLARPLARTWISVFHNHRIIIVLMCMGFIGLLYWNVRPVNIASGTQPPVKTTSPPAGSGGTAEPTTPSPVTPPVIKSLEGKYTFGTSAFSSYRELVVNEALIIQSSSGLAIDGEVKQQIGEQFIKISGTVERVEKGFSVVGVVAINHDEFNDYSCSKRGTMTFVEDRGQWVFTDLGKRKNRTVCSLKVVLNGPE